MKKICVIIDNEYIYINFIELLKKHYWREKYIFSFYYSKGNDAFQTKCEQNNWSQIEEICLKEKKQEFFDEFDLFLSLHCKQLFPKELVNNYRCINFHPGFNPYNRGWYPQVFSIMNKYPIGVTIHEMDEEIDHGPIIIQEEIVVESDDVSSDVYIKILELELQLIDEHLENLIEGNYSTRTVEMKGNINYRKDFVKLCEIDLNKKATYREVIDYLRAMSFDGYNNAYFYDQNGEKVFVNIQLEKESYLIN